MMACPGEGRLNRPCIMVSKAHFRVKTGNIMVSTAHFHVKTGDQDDMSMDSRPGDVLFSSVMSDCATFGRSSSVLSSKGVVASLGEFRMTRITPIYEYVHNFVKSYNM